MTRTIEVTTPGRIHCGLTSFGTSGRQHGGLGLMLDDVGVSLSVASAPTFQSSGPLRKRVDTFARHFASHQKLTSLPACHIEVLSTSPDHVGLGVGTQLGLAVCAGLAEWLELPWRDPQLLRAMSGRGRRSAIGTYGFLQGGLLFDAGKLPQETLGRLADRVEIPAEWRFVLVRQPEARGLAGSDESHAISELPPVPPSVTEELERLIQNEILPAARAADCDAFGSALFSYGHLAGECFAKAQGGPFATPAIETLVHRIRQLGIPGVGQSSWGPTVFAVTSCHAVAEKLVSDLQADNLYRNDEVVITKPNNSGCSVRVKLEGDQHVNDAN